MREIGQAAFAAAVVVIRTMPAIAQDTVAIEAAQALWVEDFATGHGAKAAEMVFTEDGRLPPDAVPLVASQCFSMACHDPPSM